MQQVVVVVLSWVLVVSVVSPVHAQQRPLAFAYGGNYSSSAPTYVTYHTTIEIPTKLVADGQFYSADMAGFRAYLETLRVTNPSLFAELDRDTAAIESVSQLSDMVLWGGVVVGGAIVIVGGIVYATRDCDEHLGPTPTGRWNECQEGLTSQLFHTTAIGLLVGIAGVLVGVALAPDDSVFIESVNKHNRLNPRNPLQLQIGFNAGPHYATGNVRMSF